MAKEVSKIASDGGVPDYLKGMTPDQARDNSNFDSSDVVIPMIKLLQGTSPEVEAFDTAKPGIYWHTGMDVPLGDTVDFVVCFRKKRYMLVAPMEDGQGVLARADDFTTWDRKGKWDVKLKDVKAPVTWEIDDLDVNASGLDRWGTSNPEDDNSPPAATLFYDYIVYLPDFPDLSPVALTLTRSKIKKAKRGLNDKISLQSGSGRPMQSLVFQASVMKETNDANQPFNNVAFRSNGFATKEVYEGCVEIGKSFAELNYTVKGDESEASEEAQGEKSESSEF